VSGVVLGALNVPYWGQTLLKVLAILVVLPLGALVLVYVYLFKMVSFLQSRLGPMEAGPKGVLQPIAEFGKFIQKEDIFPARVDRWVFAAAPFIVLMSTFLIYVVIPVGPTAVIENLDTGIFFALAVSSLSVIGILMAGWASANKYSLMGGLRAAGQLIAYELPLVLAVVGVVMQAGSLSLQRIVGAQANFHIFGLNLRGLPFIVPQFIGFLIFVVAAQAELTQTPFDMPVAESELVAGYMTEYSGIRFLLFFIAEFATAFALAAVGATLFLGGWYFPGLGHIVNSGWGLDLIGAGVLFTKVMLLAFVIFWVRFTFPRLREDQLQAFAWKILIPLSLLNILATGIVKVAWHG
jgi:NADH-quinone oxidoreductase subunit H